MDTSLQGDVARRASSAVSSLVSVRMSPHRASPPRNFFRDFTGSRRLQSLLATGTMDGDVARLPDFTAKLRIGCSGWGYDDWLGGFSPPGPPEPDHPQR